MTIANIRDIVLIVAGIVFVLAHLGANLGVI